MERSECGFRLSNLKQMLTLVDDLIKIIFRFDSLNPHASSAQDRKINQISTKGVR